MILVGHMAHMGEKRVSYWVWWGNLRESDHLEDLGLSGKIILKRVFKQSVGRTWIRLILFGIGNSGGLM
jgi:hypothetical protein